MTTKKTNPHSPLPGTEVEHFEYQRSAAEGYLDKYGRELPSPLPIAPPIGYRKSPTLAEQIRAMVISEKLKAEALAAGQETFYEADDFDVGDDYDPRSPYEEVFEPVINNAPWLPAPADPPAKPEGGQPPAPPAPAEGKG